MPNFEHEHKLAPRMVIGIDEAGCGPWAGPIFAAGVCFKNTTTQTLPWLDQINDSKKISQKKRTELFLKLTNCEQILYGIGQVSSQEIDQIGLSMAITLAIERAIMLIPEYAEKSLLIDGIRKPKINHDINMLIKGDQKSISIASASILAKVSRDQYMQQIAQNYPMYHWESNAGYGTKKHQQAIYEHGICEHHRLSYKPIKTYLETKS